MLAKVAIIIETAKYLGIGFEKINSSPFNESSRSIINRWSIPPLKALIFSSGLIFMFAFFIKIFAFSFKFFFV